MTSKAAGLSLIVAVLAQPSLGQGRSGLEVSLVQKDASRCDQKAIQQAKDDFNKVMKDYAAAAAQRDGINAKMSAA